MAVNTGKSNAKWIRVFVESSDGGNRDISPSTNNVTIPINYATTDVTGYSDGVTNVTIGQPSMVIAMDGVFSNAATTGSHTVLKGVVGYTGSNAPLTITIQVGIRKAPENGDPEFEGLFYCTNYVVNGDLTWNATFQPASGTVPAWGVMS